MHDSRLDQSHPSTHADTNRSAPPLVTTVQVEDIWGTETHAAAIVARQWITHGARRINAIGSILTHHPNVWAYADEVFRSPSNAEFRTMFTQMARFFECITSSIQDAPVAHDSHVTSGSLRQLVQHYESSLQPLMQELSVLLENAHRLFPGFARAISDTMSRMLGTNSELVHALDDLSTSFHQRLLRLRSLAKVASPQIGVQDKTTLGFAAIAATIRSACTEGIDCEIDPSDFELPCDAERLTSVLEGVLDALSHVSSAYRAGINATYADRMKPGEIPPKDDESVWAQEFLIKAPLMAIRSPNDFDLKVSVPFFALSSTYNPAETIESLKEGMNRVADAFRAKCKELGAEVHLELAGPIDENNPWDSYVITISFVPIENEVTEVIDSRHRETFPETFVSSPQNPFIPEETANPTREMWRHGASIPCVSPAGKSFSFRSTLASSLRQEILDIPGVWSSITALVDSNPDFDFVSLYLDLERMEQPAVAGTEDDELTGDDLDDDVEGITLSPFDAPDLFRIAISSRAKSQWATTENWLLELSDYVRAFRAATSRPWSSVFSPLHSSISQHTTSWLALDLETLRDTKCLSLIQSIYRRDFPISSLMLPRGTAEARRDSLARVRFFLRDLNRFLDTPEHAWVKTLAAQFGLSARAGTVEYDDGDDAHISGLIFIRDPNRGVVYQGTHLVERQTFDDPVSLRAAQSANVVAELVTAAINECLAVDNSFTFETLAAALSARHVRLPHDLCHFLFSHFRHHVFAVPREVTLRDVYPVIWDSLYSSPHTVVEGADGVVVTSMMDSPNVL